MTVPVTITITCTPITNLENIIWLKRERTAWLSLNSIAKYSRKPSSHKRSSYDVDILNDFPEQKYSPKKIGSKNYNIVKNISQIYKNVYWKT